MSATALARARDILREVYGYADFRGEQAGAIGAALAGRDSVVLMPTGGGKSLCYQLPPQVLQGCALVVSPLIALMHDQVQALAQNGVAAGCLNSSQSAAEQAEVIRRLRAGELRVLYCAPERVLKPQTLTLLKAANVVLVAIDEAHCVSQWGHDFRSDYLALDQLGAALPGVPRMALTATADERTREDIARRLALADPACFVGGFDRPNIRYGVRPRVDERAQLRAFLADRAGQAGIVYCMSRKKVEAIAAWLAGLGIDALPYHAGLDDAVRRANQERFLRDEAVVMVATIAFGMGIDKPDVRFVVHLDLPKSVEAYYQETGRAGRDGEPAEAWMVYGLQDVVRLRQMVDQSPAEEEHKRIERHKLDALLGWCESIGCRRRPLLEYFGERLGQPCGNCDNCLAPPRTFDATEEAQKLLSCIYRTGQRFGAAHVIDVLRGADNDKIRGHGHDQLSTFGIGAEQNVQHWRSVLRQLMVRGAVYADVEGYGALKLGPGARALLRGEITLELREDSVEPRGGSRRRGAGAAAVAADLGPADAALFEHLRGVRKRLADEQGVPPYVIFHDRTLRDMAVRRPATLADMLEVSGVGRAKLERYGLAFLEALTE
ncbi:MAG: DNA helicase RecQ [Gammaproteobacteria bacterium]